MSHYWEPKKLGTSYSETTHLFGFKLWLHGVLMRAPCCRSFKSNRCLVSEYEVPNFLGSQEWDIFWGTPCTTLTTWPVWPPSLRRWLSPSWSNLAPGLAHSCPSGQSEASESGPKWFPIPKNLWVDTKMSRKWVTPPWRGSPALQEVTGGRTCDTHVNV